MRMELLVNSSIKDEITIMRARMPKEKTITNSAKIMELSNQYYDIFEESVTLMTDDAKKSVQDESNNIYTELKKYKVIEIPSELELIINENYGLKIKNTVIFFRTLIWR